MLPLLFHKKLFAGLVFGFIMSTVVGTLTHEAGHYLVARYFSRNGVRISYAYTATGRSYADTNFFNLRDKYMAYKKKHQPFPEKEQYEKLKSEYARQENTITAAGPLETIIAGSMGVALLFFLRKKYTSVQKLAWWQWPIIFLALSWLREPFNMLTAIAGLHFIKGRQHFRLDEFALSEALGYWPWTGVILTGITGAIVVCFVIFKFIPPKQRATFLLAGLIGGISGAIIWLHLLGPMLMP